MAWTNKESKVDYTGASAQEYVDRYTNRPEDAGNLEGIQNILSNIGMVPGVGEPADLLNSLLYGMQGKGKEAGLSALSMLPFIGGLVKPGRKAGKAIGHSAALESEIGEAISKQWTPSAASKHHRRAFHEGDDIVEEMQKQQYKESNVGSFFENYLDDLFDSFKGKEY